MRTNTDKKNQLAFDHVADVYDIGRPTYPDELYLTIAKRGNLDRHSNVIEVGAGTGQATVELVSLFGKIIAIEPGERLATIARENCSQFDDVEIICSKFENWQANEIQCDAIVSANAFHWVDLELGLSKAREILKPNGILAIWWSVPYFPMQEIREIQAAAAARYNVGVLGALSTASALAPLFEGRSDFDNKPLWKLDEDSVFKWKDILNPETFSALATSYADVASLEPSQCLEYRETIENSLREIKVKKIIVEHAALLRIAHAC